MSRTIGAVSRGIRTPIIVEGDNLVDITVQSLLEAFEEEKDGKVREYVSNVTSPELLAYIPEEAESGCQPETVGADQ